MTGIANGTKKCEPVVAPKGLTMPYVRLVVLILNLVFVTHSSGLEPLDENAQKSKATKSNTDKKAKKADKK